DVAQRAVAATVAARQQLRRVRLEAGRGRAPVLCRRAQRREIDLRGTRLLLDLRQIVDVADDRGRVVRVAQRIDVGVGQAQGRDAEDLRRGGLVHVAGV